MVLFVFSLKMAFELREWLEALPRLSFSGGELVVFVAVASITLILWRFLSIPSNLPPGPWGFPFVGYLPFLGEKSHEVFNDLAKTYGDIFSLYLGNRLVIVLNSYEAIKEAFIKQGDNFAGRPGIEFLRKNEVPGLFNAETEIFRDYKRFTLSTLREFGFGKLSLEPRLKEEIIHLLKVLKSFNGKPTDIGELLRMSIANVICTIKFGSRREYGDKYFQKVIRILCNLLNQVEPVDYRLFLPVLDKIPVLRRLFGYESPDELNNMFVAEIQRLVDECSLNHKEGEESDFVSCWLTEAEKRGAENGKNFTNAHLVQVVRALFIAGSDTTANSLRWSILYLMAFPPVQTRLHEEIDRVIGHERLPSTNDRDLMPYTEATIMEVQRISSLVPLAINHCNLKETTLRGFFVPKRTVIMPNLWAVHNDPVTYPEPEMFRPERFLDSDGKLIKAEKFIPFSIGKRQCLGESLARMELFLYFTSMLQRFSFKKPMGDTISFDYDMSVIAIPKPFRVEIILRNEAKTLDLQNL